MGRIDEISTFNRGCEFFLLSIIHKLTDAEFSVQAADQAKFVNATKDPVEMVTRLIRENIPFLESQASIISY